MPRNTYFRQATTFGCLALAFSLAACASNPERRGPPKGETQGERGAPSPRQSGTFIKPIGLLFADFDANNDLQISSSESEAGIRAHWRQLSGQGSVGAINYTAWAERVMGSRDAKPTMMSIDSDFNGVLTEGEFNDGFAREFNRLDKNRDGQITRAEMVFEVAAQQGRKRESAGQEKGQRGGRGGGRSGGR